ncbi:MAG: hypothetical protein R3D44_03700 [Hyphomicrobiaceae bacterium]
MTQRYTAAGSVQETQYSCDRAVVPAEAAAVATPKAHNAWGRAILALNI